MKKILLAALIGALALFAPRPAAAINCPVVHTYVTGETLIATNLNANETQWANCFLNLDYRNIGAAGIQAAQIIPTSGAQATFGGSLVYTFPSGVTLASGVFTGNGSGLTGIPGSAITGGVVTSVSGTGNIASTGGSTPTISISDNPSFSGSLSASGGLTSGSGLNTGGPILGATTGSFSGAVQTSSDGTTKAYVPPTYNHLGTSLASKTHQVSDAVTASGASTTITLTGAAIFTVINTITIYDFTSNAYIAATSVASNSVVFPSVNGHIYGYLFVGRSVDPNRLLDPANPPPLFASKRRSGQRSGRGQYVDVTFAAANADQAIPVALPAKPSMYVVIRKSAPCDVYDGANLGADWTASKIVLRSTTAATLTLYVN